MDNLVFSLNVTVPIFLVIVLGYFLVNKKLFTKEFVTVADKFVFKVALPLLLFRDISTMNLKQDFNLTFVLFCMLTTTTMFFGTWGIASVCFKDKSLVGAFSQASVRGSVAVLGIAFVTNVYGSAGMTPLMIVASVPLFNIYSVIILTFSSKDAYELKQSGQNKVLMRNALKNIVTNPIILGILAGVPISLFEIELPQILSRTVSSVASCATPIALLTVGASFEGKQAVKQLKPTVIATCIKLMILPVLFLPIAYLLGFRNSELIAILTMLGSPSTVTCYIMAKNMGNDAQLSSGIVVTTTLFSAASLTFWIFLLRTMQCI